jgi:hypothetical protein
LERCCCTRQRWSPPVGRRCSNSGFPSCCCLPARLGARLLLMFVIGRGCVVCQALHSEQITRTRVCVANEYSRRPSRGSDARRPEAGAVAGVQLAGYLVCSLALVDSQTHIAIARLRGTQLKQRYSAACTSEARWPSPLGHSRRKFRVPGASRAAGDVRLGETTRPGPVCEHQPAALAGAGTPPKWGVQQLARQPPRHARRRFPAADCVRRQ